MSVIKFKTKIFADVASTIRYSAEFRERFENSEERLMSSVYKSTEKDLEHSILCFAERLYIANACAYGVQYSEDPIEIKRLEPGDLEGSLLNTRDFYELLRSIRYNLRTNAGRSFISKEDYERVSWYINYLAAKLARGKA